MSDAIFPLLVLAVIYCVFAFLARTAKSVMRQQKPSPGVRTPAPRSVPEPESIAEPAVSEMQPTVRVTVHDDSVYQGSMNAVTGEGYDPCHDEQLAPLTRSERTEDVQVTVPGLRLNWTGEEIVRGLVVSEVLKRRA